MTSPSKKKKPAPKDLQLAELSKGLDPAEVKKRPQGSGSVSYVTGEYIKRTLNRIFGFSNWSSEIVEMCCQDDSGGPWARARVKLEVVFADGVKVAREDVGFGSASPKQRDGRELAGKEAVTDGIKRAASSLGNQFGGSLYDSGNDLHRGGSDVHAAKATEEDLERLEVALDAMGITPSGFAGFLASKGRPGPSEMTPESLRKALGWMRGPGLAAYNAWDCSEG